MISENKTQFNSNQM